MNRISRLALGTAQFGLDYGVTNAEGRVAQAEAERIVRAAFAEGISIVDTAAAYGCSEAVLGGFVGELPGVRIITKLPPLTDRSLTPEHARAVVAQFNEQREQLKAATIYGYLFHRSSDLLKPGGALVWSALSELRREGVVKKIGVSVYSPGEALKILEHFDVDIIQAPFNVFDQRILDCAFVREVKRRRIELHVRSAFLQGTLLAPPEQLPPVVKLHADAFRAFTRHCRDQSVSPLSACLDFCMRAPHVKAVVVGVCSMRQLRQIMEATAHGGGLVDYGPFASDRLDLIEPSRWIRA